MQRSAGQVSDDLAQDAGDQIRLCARLLAPINNEVLPPSAKCGCLFGREQSALADLQETPVFGQHAQALGDEVAGQRIEDEIYPLSIGQALNLICEVEAARVHHMRRSQRLQSGALFRAASGGKDFCSGALGKLDGGHADAARPGVDQDLFAALDLPQVFQGVAGGDERN